MGTLLTASDRRGEADDFCVAKRLIDPDFGMAYSRFHRFVRLVRRETPTEQTADESRTNE